MTLKKGWFLLVLLTLCMALFAGCTSSADMMPSQSPAVSVSPMASPEITVTSMPTNSPPAMGAGLGADAGNGTLEDAVRIAKAVKAEAEKLSEVDEAQAVVAGNLALVGISYDAQYQSGLTQRLSGMVQTRAEAADTTITTTHVTDDETLVKQIKALYDQAEGNQITLSELQNGVLELSGSMSAAPMATSTGAGT